VFCLAVLALCFPYYTATILRIRDGVVVISEPHGPYFFALSAPDLTTRFGYAVRQVWAIDWSRTIHAFLLLAGVSVGSYLLGSAIHIHKKLRKTNEEANQDRHKELFTDEIVQEILSGKPSVKIQGKAYIVCENGLRTAETNIVSLDGHSSFRFGGFIPFPKELLSTLEDHSARPS
jgi:hypothetical protein